MQINRKQLAELFNVSLTAVDNWLRAGCPIAARGARGKPASFDVSKVIAWREEQLSNRHGAPSCRDDGDSYLEAQRRKENALAKLRELEVGRKSGELIPASDVETAWSSIISSARSRLLLIPDKVAPKVAVVSDVLECRAIITQEIREALTALSEDKE